MTTSIDLLGTLKGKGAVRAERIIAVVFERGEEVEMGILQQFVDI